MANAEAEEGRLVMELISTGIQAFSSQCSAQSDPLSLWAAGEEQAAGGGGAAGAAAAAAADGGGGGVRFSLALLCNDSAGYINMSV